MAPLSSPMADVLFSAINDDDKELALFESKRVLRSRMNDQLPIFRLPTEILTMVFRYLEEEQRFDESASDDIPACVVAAQVCEYWRKVAHECPALWTFIRTSSPRWLAIMLERSKNRPLVVMYKSPTPLHDCLELILLHLPRIKFLQFRALPADCDRIIQLLSSQPAPLLETFEFAKPVRPLRVPVIRPISNNIFQGQAPRLRSLQLTSLKIDWTAHIFSGLRTLSIRQPEKESFPTLSQLLSALQRMPALEHLGLERLLIKYEETELLQKVPLPRLKSIALGNPSIAGAALIFKQLLLPVDTKISLSLIVEGHHDISDLFAAMDMHPGKSSSIIRSMRASSHWYSSLCVQFSTSSAMNPADFWNPSDDDIRLSIEFRYCDDIFPQTHEPSIIFDTCRMVPQGRIQTLYLSGFDLPERDFWRAGSACLPDLEAIHLEGIQLWDLITALEIIDNGQTLDILYPSLRVLELEAACFCETFAEPLQHTMKMRAKHGVGIHTLRLAKCRDLQANQVQAFREVIATVDWDEYQFQEPGIDSSDAKILSLESIIYQLENEPTVWYDDAENDRGVY